MAEVHDSGVFETPKDVHDVEHRDFVALCLSNQVNDPFGLLSHVLLDRVQVFFTIVAGFSTQDRIKVFTKVLFFKKGFSFIEG
jgi:hypothetical protein